MISYLCALFLVVNPTVKEEKAWVAEQKEEIALLKEEKKEATRGNSGRKGSTPQAFTEYLEDKKASVRDLFPMQIQLQHRLLFPRCDR